MEMYEYQKALYRTSSGRSLLRQPWFVSPKVPCRGCLVMVSFQVRPTCHVTQAKDRKKGGVYDAPTYRVKRRTGLNFISTFQLRTEDDKSKWILRGVALLGSID
jgi:hypothetical protein